MPYLESEQKFHQRNGSVDMKIMVLRNNSKFSFNFLKNKLFKFFVHESIDLR